MIVPIQIVSTCLTYCRLSAVICTLAVIWRVTFALAHKGCKQSRTKCVEIFELHAIIDIYIYIYIYTIT